MSITVEIDLSKPEGSPVWHAQGRLLGGMGEQQIYGEAQTGRRAIENAVHDLLGHIAQGDEKRIVLFSALAGYVAMWAVRLSPYPVPDGLAAVLAEFEEKVRPLFPICQPSCPMREMTEREIEAMLVEYLLPIAEVQAWNERRNGSKAPYGVVTSTSRPDPDDDFIDLYALVRNIARSTASESEG